MPEPTHSHPAEITLHAYLDGALDAATHAQVQAHVAGCPTCSARLAQLAALFTALEALPDVPLRRDLTPAVLEALQPARTTLPIPRWAVALQLASAVVLLAFAWPWLAGRLAGYVAAPLRAQIVAGVLNTWQALFAWWPALVTSASELTLPDLDVARYAPALQLSPLAWWLLIGSAVVLWLAGNGLLLRLSGGEPNGHS